MPLAREILFVSTTIFSTEVASVCFETFFRNIPIFLTKLKLNSFTGSDAFMEIQILRSYFFCAVITK